MIELNLDIKIHMAAWKKALLFSFSFYLIVLFILLVMITFTYKHFVLGLVLRISAAYLTALTLSFRYMHKKFKEKFDSLK